VSAPAGPPAPPVAGGWRRIPLWLRLVTTLLVLAFAGLTIAGVFGLRLLRDDLVARADAQLDEATNAATTSQAELAAGIEADEKGVLPSDFYFRVVDLSGLRTIAEHAAPLSPDESPPTLPRLDGEEAADRTGEPFTVGSVDGHDRWRVLVTPVRMRATGERGTLLVATSLRETDDTVKNLLRIDVVVGGLVLLGLALAGYTMVRAAMRPLSDIERTAAAIAGGDLSRRIADEDPSTEVGRLGRALNVMLGRIEGAFREREASEARARQSEDRMRQFVADASHELRTPLTSIRGFAELHRQGAVTDPAEVSGLLERIEGEATRMGLLVEDLLLLARLDRQRPLQRQPVDLVVVAADAVEAARLRAPMRPLRLELPPAEASSGGAGAEDGERSERGADTAGVVVPGDEARLRQVVTNLVDNALQHTSPTTPVTVRVTTRPGLGVIEVSDEGPGLTREQADHVFERFYRTDTARTRAQGGTGLGLSIVAAIAVAHGGRVEVDTAPGQGATFRALLPTEVPAIPSGPPVPPVPPPPAPAPAG
jgi:two-component system OmpR family sensor kinase